VPDAQADLVSAFQIRQTHVRSSEINN
jgi:hypothetical protein